MSHARPIVALGAAVLFSMLLAAQANAASPSLLAATPDASSSSRLAVSGAADGATGLPSYQAVKDQFRASDVRVLDRNGQPLQRVRSDYQGRRGDWLALADVSPAFANAVILSEDQRFYEHSGVDWQAIVAAAWSNVSHRQRRGASTISMQVVGLIDDQLRRAPSGRSIMQKIDQALQAQALERNWTKAQILEAYLNLVSFRGELVGVDALSRVLFQKHASGLDARESALAAVMLRAPNASRKALAQRTCGLLQSMGFSQECRGLVDFIGYSVRRGSAPRGDGDNLAPHFARWVLSQAAAAPGDSITTSMDISLQRFVIDSVDRNLRALRASHVSDAAVVVLDNETGQVLAYLGSSGSLSGAAAVDHAQALRQAGSTLKPFLYAQAIEQERLTSVSLLDDGPLNLPTGNGLYIPQNYDRHFAGWVSVRTALASSLNIPAVRALVMVTPDAFQQRLVRLGLPLDRSGDFYGYSLALGSADVSLLTLTNAYRALANQGGYSSARFLPSSVPAEQMQAVMSKGAAWIVGDILSDRQARARTFGLDSPLSTPFWSAVKTGTSKDMRDNWCVGWSQRYTVGVWVGNSGGASMREVSGVSGAGPIWHEIMAYLHRQSGSRQASAPADVTRLWVSFEDSLEPRREDVFIGDTTQSLVRLNRTPADLQHAAASILQPINGTILAVDPDIPAANQRTWFRASGVAAENRRQVFWRLDGKQIGEGGELAWMPWPGKHRIELVDAHGKVLDDVAIEVRGASPGQSLPSH